MSAISRTKRGDRPREHHYAFEAASLVLKGRDHLQRVIECDRHRHPNLLDLDQSLRSIEQYLHGYLIQLLEQERNLLSSYSCNHETPQYPGASTDANHSSGKRNRRSFLMTSGQSCAEVTSTDASFAPWSVSGRPMETDSALTCLKNAVNDLRRVTTLKEKYKQRLSLSVKIGSKSTILDDSLTGMAGTRKSSEDYLLFRLIVILQLCLVRIQEADTILCRRLIRGKKMEEMQCIQDYAHQKVHDRAVFRKDENLHHATRQDVNDDGSLNEAASRSIQRQSSHYTEEGEEDVVQGSADTTVVIRNQRNGQAWSYLGLSFLSSTYLFSVRSGMSIYKSTPQAFLRSLVSDSRQSHDSFDSTAKTMGHMWTTRFAQTSLFLSASLLLRRGWRVLCMNARLENTVTLVEDWCAQWNLIESIGSCGGKIIGDNTVHEQQCRRILQLIPVPSSQSSVWQQFSLSDAGALRFSLIKWAMNMLYASVGTAMQVLSGKKYLDSHMGEQEGQMKKTFWGQVMPHVLMSVTAAAAASYYAIVGPSAKSAQVTQSTCRSEGIEKNQPTHESSVDLLRNTWGMVSLPVVKSLSLQVSRLLKGAAVAERVVLGDLPCFILSQSPCPEIVIALKRQRRHQDRRRLSKLNTILESVYDNVRDSASLRSSSRVVNVDDYPKRDVIIHLTGGGFLAHTIAGDVPFLIDWSASCKAVVLIPEYSLLPDHVFPTALDEINRLYVGVRRGLYIPLIGFQANKIIVTGESSGGNLGAALCVKLCMDGGKIEDPVRSYAADFIENLKSTDAEVDLTRLSEQLKLSETSSHLKEQEVATSRMDMPDAIMFCCPMLNLSPDLSPSRIFGNSDPVLPSSLLRAISDSYVPEKGIKEDIVSTLVERTELSYHEGIDHSKCQVKDAKKNPLVSPFFAPDNVLRFFPPTLLYGSSEDPFLDDSVSFNARLRSLGVESDLRATMHMAHAFWGLGTAGFPEAIQAQTECQEWLKMHFQK